jgi:transcription initiation factor TFIIE subunit beta
MDKKKIVFYNDKTAALPVDEEFQKLWRSVAVESMDDQKIEEYLEKQVSVEDCMDQNFSVFPSLA